MDLIQFRNRQARRPHDENGGRPRSRLDGYRQALGIGSSVVVEKVRRCLNAQKADAPILGDSICTRNGSRRPRRRPMRWMELNIPNSPSPSVRKPKPALEGRDRNHGRLPNDAAIKGFLLHRQMTDAAEMFGDQVDGKKTYKPRDGKSVISPRKVFVAV